MARDAIQVFGGYGFTRELGDDGTPYRLEAIPRLEDRRDLRGVNEIQKWIIARSILGREITG